MSSNILDYLSSKELSKLPLIDPLTTPRYFVIGYDHDGEGRLVRYDVASIAAIAGIKLVDAPSSLGPDEDDTPGRIAFDETYIYTYHEDNGWAKSPRTF